MPEELNSKLPLNEGQARRMTIVFARLESALRDLRANVLHPPESLRLTHYEDPIDPTLAEPLVQEIARAQTQVEQMARDLDLQAGMNSVRRTHLVTLELLSIDLYASRTKGLRGYGKVAQATADYLEREIPKLDATVQSLLHLLQQTSAAGRPHDLTVTHPDKQKSH